MQTVWKWVKNDVIISKKIKITIQSVSVFFFVYYVWVSIQWWAPRISSLGVFLRCVWICLHFYEIWNFSELIMKSWPVDVDEHADHCELIAVLVFSRMIGYMFSFFHILFLFVLFLSFFFNLCCCRCRCWCWCKFLFHLPGIHRFSA